MCGGRFCVPREHPLASHTVCVASSETVSCVDAAQSPGRLNDRPEVFARALSTDSNIEQQASFVVNRAKHGVDQGLLRPIDQAAASR